MDKLKSAKSQQLYKEAKRMIPGGTQLLSKRPEMFLPGFWPAYYRKAKGCEIWDLDGNRYVDMNSMGVGSCILGYADQDVNKAVKSAIDRGSMSTLNTAEEVELAHLLVRLHPWAKMVRYARSGGEAMAVAVRIARAYSRKDVVLFCGYHGWHDWYLAANIASEKALDEHLLPGLSPLGVPRQLRGTAYPFKYNDTASFLKLVNKHKGKIGVVVLETIRNYYPEKNFIQAIRSKTYDLNIPLVLDEVTAGFRLNVGGAHLLFALEPDIAVFAKGISNGFPMAAIIGKRAIMEATQGTFISSTYWTDMVGPTAALATIKKMEKKDVPQHLDMVGRKIQGGWKSLALKHKLKIGVGGIAPLAHFSFPRKNPLLLKTLFTQFMLDHGFLATGAVYASFAHKTEYIDRYLDTVDKAFYFIAKAVSDGNPERKLRGPLCHSGFRRIT